MLRFSTSVLVVLKWFSALFTSSSDNWDSSSSLSENFLVAFEVNFVDISGPLNLNVVELFSTNDLSIMLFTISSEYGFCDI